MSSTTIADQLNSLADVVHVANQKWWVALETGEPKERNVGELLMLMVSELAEAMEGHRKNLMDAKLPHRTAEEVEMADLLIRALDYCGGRKLDIGNAFVEKMIYNQNREDHKREARLGPNGKKY